MKAAEIPVMFACGDAVLYGILHRPTKPARRAVLVVVGGPQYRIGSHRQFVLLARELASAGIATFRFDQRGSGDSEGEPASFEHIQLDVRAAIDTLHAHVPILQETVIWGLCDAASAACFYAHTDPRVTGLVLLNPWVRTDESFARTQLKHYYVKRLLDSEFWGKIRRGEFDFADSARSLIGVIRRILFPATKRSRGLGEGKPQIDGFDKTLPGRMLHRLIRFRGHILIILSGNDLTAAEFKQCVDNSCQWRRLLSDSRVELQHQPTADHTFSRKEWRDQVADWTLRWLCSW